MDPEAGRPIHLALRWWSWRGLLGACLGSDWPTFCRLDITATEISVIGRIFQLPHDVDQTLTGGSLFLWLSCDRGALNFLDMKIIQKGQLPPQRSLGSETFSVAASEAGLGSTFNIAKLIQTLDPTVIAFEEVRKLDRQSSFELVRPYQVGTTSNGRGIPGTEPLPARCRV